jgi:very-short-patch-repair endonuclease
MSDLKRILTQTARDLRNDPTDTEKLLWKHLCRKQLEGHKFRRQQRIGKFIVDFVCLEKKLAIELDGGQHFEQRERDFERDHWLACEGYKVIRFWNNEVIQNLEGVLEEISRHLQSPSP